MIKYTMEDIKEFIINDYGYTIYPSGDYTDIKEFGNKCSFGEGSVFGELNSFGERCTCEDGKEFTQMCIVGGFGSENRTTQFWLLVDNTIYVRCGCFAGTLNEFSDKVHETHEDTKYEKEYIAAIELAKIRFKL